MSFLLWIFFVNFNNTSNISNVSHKTISPARNAGLVQNICKIIYQQEEEYGIIRRFCHLFCGRFGKFQ